MLSDVGGGVRQREMNLNIEIKMILYADPSPPSSSHIFKEDKSKPRSAGSWAQGRENQKTLDRIIKTHNRKKTGQFIPLWGCFYCSVLSSISRFTFSWRKTAAETWESVKQKSMKASSAVKHLRSDFHQINQVLQEEKIQTKQNRVTICKLQPSTFFKNIKLWPQS